MVSKVKPRTEVGVKGEREGDSGEWRREVSSRRGMRVTHADK